MRSPTGVGVLVLTTACSARQAPPVQTPAISKEGVTGVRVLGKPEGDTTNVEDAQVQSITPAYSSEENGLPVYPVSALQADCPDGAVAVRVTVGEDGNTSLLREVPGRPVPADDCHEAFWNAAVDAVREWKFAPAYRQTQREGRDADGDGRPDYFWWDQEPVAIYLDFEFTFRIVEGRGEVSSR